MQFNGGAVCSSVPERVGLDSSDSGHLKGNKKIQKLEMVLVRADARLFPLLRPAECRIVKGAESSAPPYVPARAARFATTWLC